MDTTTRRRLAQTLAALTIIFGAVGLGTYIATNHDTYPVYEQTYDGDYFRGDMRCERAGVSGWDRAGSPGPEDTYRCAGYESASTTATTKECILVPGGPDGQPFIRCGTSSFTQSYPNLRRFEPGRG